MLPINSLSLTTGSEATAPIDTDTVADHDVPTVPAPKDYETEVKADYKAFWYRGGEERWWWLCAEHFFAAVSDDIEFEQVLPVRGANPYAGHDWCERCHDRDTTQAAWDRMRAAKDEDPTA